LYYSTALDNTDISTSGKGKTPASTNDVKAYSKEILDDEIHRLTIANAQLVVDKIKTEKVKVNLKADRVRLLGKKNSLVVKKKEFRTEIIALNAARSSNVPIRRH